MNIRLDGVTLNSAGISSRDQTSPMNGTVAAVTCLLESQSTRLGYFDSVCRIFNAEPTTLSQPDQELAARQTLCVGRVSRLFDVGPNKLYLRAINNLFSTFTADYGLAGNC